MSLKPTEYQSHLSLLKPMHRKTSGHAQSGKKTTDNTLCNQKFSSKN